jgi:putative hydrolase of the HAD superfamily
VKRAVFFDLDGVIRHWDPSAMRALEERGGLPAGAVLAAAFQPALLERAVLGLIDDEAWRGAVGEAIAAAHGRAAASAIDPWRRLLGGIDPEMVALVAEVRGRARVGLITNATTRLEDELVLFGLDGAFDAVINSARVGLAKPDPRIFQLAADRLGCPPEGCLFIDDTAGHVAAARTVGMTGIHFAGLAALRRELAGLGLCADQ